MKILTWIVQILAAIAFLGAGLMKLFTPYADLIADPNTAWAEDFSSTQIKIIAILEVLGAIGLILPMILNKYKVLVPISAIGLALTMVGAMVTHLGRGESVIPNVVLLILTLAIVWLRRDFFKNKID